MTDQKLLTLTEISRYLNIHRMTLYRMAQQRKIPASKVGRVWRFRKNRIDEWLDKQEKSKPRNQVTGKVRS
jgi:excisionase family DNA binding protein